MRHSNSLISVLSRINIYATTHVSSTTSVIQIFYYHNGKICLVSLLPHTLFNTYINIAIFVPRFLESWHLLFPSAIYLIQVVSELNGQRSWTDSQLSLRACCLVGPGLQECGSFQIQPEPNVLTQKIKIFQLTASYEDIQGLNDDIPQGALAPQSPLCATGYPYSHFTAALHAHILHFFYPHLFDSHFLTPPQGFMFGSFSVYTSPLLPFYWSSNPALIHKITSI